MRLSHSLILAGALFVAAPAVAQDNNASATNATTNAADVNAASNAAAPATPSTAAATPGEQNVALPPNVATSADTGTSVAVKGRRGFPWGVVGLLGLIGLFGVRKVKA